MAGGLAQHGNDARDPYGDRRTRKSDEAGMYSEAVSITIAGATNTPVSVPITLTVVGAPVVVPTHDRRYRKTRRARLRPRFRRGLNIVIYGSNMGTGVARDAMSSARTTCSRPW